MLDRKKRTFDDDDLFTRKPYAEFLKNLILKCNNYHRNDDVKAYTIALDSPWGTGKSVFLEKFESMLEQDCKDQLCVVHYNAWENDFWDNAFEPFADAVFSHPLFASPLADQTETSAGKKLGDALKHLVVSFAKKRLDNYFDSPEMMRALESAVGAVGAATSQKTTIISPAYSVYKSNLQAMQDAMEMVLEEATPKESVQNVKLVIIIDELDRCRPTFAIETLEIVKHVMDVSNVVYLFALDVQQLGAAVKQVYGTETDATSYLMRFFSYYSRLTDTNLYALIRSEFSKIFDFQELHSLPYKMSTVAKEFQLSARDLETIIKVYKLMLKVFLQEYQNESAYLLYWCLLCQKFKKPLFYNKQMDGKISAEEIKNSIYSSKTFQELNLYSALTKISSDSQIQDLILYYRGIADRMATPEWQIVGVNLGKDETLYVQIAKRKDSIQQSTLSITKADSINGILFYQDLIRWKEIKALKIGQFFAQQMEMFNFLPTIE